MRLRIPSWLIDRIVARAQRTPYRHLPGYMERYWLFRTPLLSCRLHVILASDDDRALHDHPWSYATVILRGGYVEVRPVSPEAQMQGRFDLTNREWIAPGRVLFRRAESPHRLEVPRGQTCLTLFLTGPRRRTWGFQTPRGWVDHHEYERAIAAGEVPHSWRGAAA